MGADGRKIRPVLGARKVPLVEDGAFRDDNLLCSRIVELPALVTGRITDEDTLLHVRA